MSEAEEIAEMTVNMLTAVTKQMIAERTQKLLAESAWLFFIDLQNCGFSKAEALQIVCASMKGAGIK